MHWPAVPALEGTWVWDEAQKKVVIQLTQTQQRKPFPLRLEVRLVTEAGDVSKIEKIELRQASERFEIAADRAPSDIVLDPNTWMLMEPPKFSRRQP